MFSASCSGGLYQETDVHSELLSRSNYSIIYNESEPHSLLVDVNTDETVGNGHHLYSWRHNEHLINPAMSIRITTETNGSLIIYPVEPSDAGSYELTAINDFGCMEDIFNLYIECKFICFSLGNYARCQFM